MCAFVREALEPGLFRNGVELKASFRTCCSRSRGSKPGVSSSQDNEAQRKGPPGTIYLRTSLPVSGGVVSVSVMCAVYVERQCVCCEEVAKHRRERFDVLGLGDPSSLALDTIQYKQQLMH